MAIVEHDFENGLTVKNGTIYADYKKFYQNVYPGNGSLSGAVDPADTTFNRGGLPTLTNRDNVFNQTDFVYKTATGPVFHTVAFGTEFGRQTGIDRSQYRILSERYQHLHRQPVRSDLFRTDRLRSSFDRRQRRQVATADSNSNYRLYIESGYARDTIEFTRWLQLIAGARFDRFDMSALDQNTGIFAPPRRRQAVAAGGHDRQADREPSRSTPPIASPICRHRAISSVRSTTAP